jgi:hypothetical protein
MKTTHTADSIVAPKLPVARAGAALLLALFALLSACATGSGRLETRPFALADFDSIEADDAVELDVTRGDGFAVAVTADDNVWDALDVSREGRTLRLRLRAGVVFSGVTVRANVTMPSLVALHVAGAAHARLAGFDAPQPGLDLDASGASEIAGSVSVQTLSLHVSGSSRATLSGTATTATVDASGASTAGLAGLRATTADVALSGSSTGDVTVERTLGYDLSGASQLVYAGSPQIGRSRVSGGATVERR